MSSQSRTNPCEASLQTTRWTSPPGSQPQHTIYHFFRANRVMCSTHNAWTAYFRKNASTLAVKAKGQVRFNNP